MQTCGVLLHSGRVLGRHCGGTLPAPLETSDSFAYVHFVSDGSGNSAGFSLSFEASVEGTVTLFHSFLPLSETFTLRTQSLEGSMLLLESMALKCDWSPDVCLSFRHSLRRRVKRSLWNYFFAQLPELVPTQPGVSLGNLCAGGSAGHAHHQRPPAGGHSGLFVRLRRGKLPSHLFLVYIPIFFKHDLCFVVLHIIVCQSLYQNQCSA